MSGFSANMGAACCMIMLRRVIRLMRQQHTNPLTMQRDGDRLLGSSRTNAPGISIPEMRPRWAERPTKFQVFPVGACFDGIDRPARILHLARPFSSCTVRAENGLAFCLTARLTRRGRSPQRDHTRS